ncbi:MAG: DUF1559 domain-containing protein [Planctomycetaceae bacterium]|nr:DUF1559 domain-containing protein [Planctomycetaceae bacterium]
MPEPSNETFPADATAAAVGKGRRETLRRIISAGIVLLIPLVLFALLWPAVSTPPEVHHRSQCKNNLHQIGLALHNYHDVYHSFPPAYVADDSGRPMHSWRVLLLPFLDYTALYNEYRFDEPWNGPHNSTLHDRVLAVYRCPSEDAAKDSPEALMTSYVAIVGPETAWPGADPTRIEEISDGTSNTLLLVEVANSGIHWMEPRDLHVLQMAPTVNSKAGQGMSSRHTGGAHILMGDGAVRFLSDRVTAEILRKLITRSAGDVIRDDEF